MLRAGVLKLMVTVGLLFIATVAGAAQFNFVPAGELRTSLSAGNYSQALPQFLAQHSGSAFGTSPDGQATLAYLLYQNGMTVTGLRLLLDHTQPGQLSSELVSLWSAELKRSAVIQKGWLQTTGRWQNHYNNAPVSFTFKTYRDLTKAFATAERLPKDAINQKARIWWSIATKAPLIGQTDSALHAVKLLKESGQTVIGQDQIASTEARILFQKGEINGSLAAYSRIPKSSSLWIEAVEERAWAHLRQDDYDKAMGETVTLLSPALAPLVGPESYYLANLMALKVCDYPRIFRNSDTFKKRHRDRLSAMQALATNGTQPKLAAALERIEKEGVTIEAAGPTVEALPRSAFRDQRFTRYMGMRRALLNDASKLASAGGSATALASSDRQLAERMRILAVERLQVLARSEVAEYRQIIDKLHIVEGEVIQRMAMDDNLKGQRSKLAKTEDTGDVLVFPYKNDEVWFDELDNYKARVKDCPTLKGASL